MGAAVGKLCGREFGLQELAVVREVVAASRGESRAEIARRVCQRLSWVDERGRLKDMGARVALLSLWRKGLIDLPKARNGNGNGLEVRAPEQWPQERELSGSIQSVRGLELERVQGAESSTLWNALIERYHYLGYSPLSGEQVRYLIVHEGGVLGAIGFGAAALKVGVRDRWIGWNAQGRERGRCAVINNRRFLILPWVRIPNLASCVLGMSVRAVRRDYRALYGRDPVLLETFVEAGRFAGSCYRAANWQYLGQTAGRGRGDREHRGGLAIKDVYVYAVDRRFRQMLCGAQAS